MIMKYIKLLDNIFFKWDLLSLIIILSTTEALVLAIEGHFYNDTVLVYILPLLLWGIREKGINREKGITEKTPDLSIQVLGIAFAAGIIGGMVFVVFNSRLAMWGGEAINNVLIKALFVAAGVGTVVLYLCRCFRGWKKVTIRSLAVNFSLCLLIIPGMQLQKEISAWSVTGWITAAICFTASMVNEREEKRTRLVISVFSFLFTCFMAWGNLIQISDLLNNTGKRVLLGTCISMLGWYPVWKSFIKSLYQLIKKRIGTYEITSQKCENKPIKYYLSYIALFLAAWLPYFLAFYPGVLSSDSISQVQQVIGELPSSNHHPWIHTRLIALCYQVGYAVGGNANSGVAVYSGISMLMLAAAFAKIGVWLRLSGLSRIIRVISLLFLAFCPFNGIYSITMWKDIPFAVFVILFMVNILELAQDYQTHRTSVSHWIQFGLFSTMVCLFRSNGILAWLFTIPFMIIYFPKFINKIVALSFLVLSLYFGYQSVLLPSMNVIQPDTVESLSIPIQQIACVVAKEGELPDQAIKKLDQVVNLADIPETYQSHTSDPMKRLIRAKGNMDMISEQGTEFLKIYLDIGLKNPYYYMEAFIEQTKGYWYHKENDWIYHETFITENQISIYRDGKLPEGIIAFFETILKFCLDGFHVICSLALFTYMIIFGILTAIINRKQIAVFMPLLGIVLSLLLATPRYGDFRYIYALFAALPLCVGYMLNTFQHVQAVCSGVDNEKD